MSDETHQTFEEVADKFYQAEESEPLEVLTDDVVDDETPTEPEAEVEAEVEVEDEASENDEDDSEDDSDILTYEINGKEYSAKDIELLESGTLMQADYTKKTQALADDRKELDGNVTLLSDAITKTNDLSDQLEVLVNEDTEINWDELKEDDPDEYIKLKERADSRKSKLAEIKANNQASALPKVDVEKVRTQIVDNNPTWLKDGKQTEVYKTELAALNSFYSEGGWNQAQVDVINSDPKLFQVVLESIRKPVETKKSTAKKVIKLTSKSGKAATKQTKRSAEDIFYGS